MVKKFCLFCISMMILGALFISCATMNKLATAQTDRLGSAPFYKKYSKIIPVEDEGIYHLPLNVSDRYKNDPFAKSQSRSLHPLVEVMSRYIDSLNYSKRLETERLSIPGGPRLYIGSAESFDAPPEARQMRNENDKYPPMIIHIEKPDKQWRAAVLESLTAVEGNFLLIFSLSFDEFPKADKGLLGKKVVLGTNYEQGLNFLTAIDKPVEVLQLTGMLLDRQGNILRAGSEGILAKDTPFSLQIFDIQKGIDRKAIDKLINEERREDLPDKPLKWKVAIDNLFAKLLEK